jgi:hypothetical protein
MATEFFKCLYTEDKEVDADDLVDMLHKPISQEMNLVLCKDFSDEEGGFYLTPVASAMGSTCTTPIATILNGSAQQNTGAF